MRSKSSILIELCVVQCLTVLCVSQDFDFFYFVQQWPASLCDSQKSCCYPTTGKPAADFGIHGLWPNFLNGTYPSECDDSNTFDLSQISDLTVRLQKEWPTLACPSGDGTKFWKHEWNKHGTCSESVLDMHSFFEKCLDLKRRANLFQALKSAGINPDGKYYSLNSIKEAIKGAVGITPHIDCNEDASGNPQLWEVYLCVDTSGSDFTECPVVPPPQQGVQCGSEIQFPCFSDLMEEL